MVLISSDSELHFYGTPIFDHFVSLHQSVFFPAGVLVTAYRLQLYRLIEILHFRRSTTMHLMNARQFNPFLFLPLLEFSTL
jgi:hypothetical protein